MTIKFVCGCGKRLRAGDHMASRRMACPRCGKPVGIPAAGQIVAPTYIDPYALPTHLERKVSDPNEPGWQPNEAAAQAAAELSDRLRRLGQEAFDREVAASPRARRKRLARLPRFRHTWDPGTRWYHCLVFPAAVWGRMLVLGGILGLFAVSIPLEVQRLLIRDETQYLNHVAGLSALAIAAVALLGQISAWFTCVLAAEKSGELTVAGVPWRRVDLAARGLAAVLCTFLGGPAFLAGVGIWFWLHSGKLLPADWFILGELDLVTAGYWLFALAEACLSRWPRPANPLQVAEIAYQLGARTLVLAGLAWVQLALFIVFLSQAVRPIDHISDALPVFGTGVLMMMFGSVVLRITGMWWRQATEEMETAASQSSNSTPDSPALTSPMR
jgi:hypothetical protein